MVFFDGQDGKLLPCWLLVFRLEHWQLEISLFDGWWDADNRQVVGVKGWHGLNHVQTIISVSKTLNFCAALFTKEVDFVHESVSIFACLCKEHVVNSFTYDLKDMLNLVPHLPSGQVLCKPFTLIVDTLLQLCVCHNDRAFSWSCASCNSLTVRISVFYLFLSSRLVWKESVLSSSFASIITFR